jgi:hypothetical protein
LATPTTSSSIRSSTLSESEPKTAIKTTPSARQASTKESSLEGSASGVCNQLPFLTGQQEKSERKEFFYINDDAQMVAMRYENWKVVFCEQKVEGTLEIWAAPFVCRRLPKIFNLRLDPYERADITSNTYYDWTLQRAFLVVPAQAFVKEFVDTFKEFPPRQKPSSFSVEQSIGANVAVTGWVIAVPNTRKCICEYLAIKEIFPSSTGSQGVGSRLLR